MRISREKLTSESQATGFRSEVLEKAIHLLNLLEGFNRHLFLKGRWALKGGTALNLFLFDVQRLSVDIDLNYIGAVDRETMTAERPKFEQAMQAVCSRERRANICGMANYPVTGHLFACSLRLEQIATCFSTMSPIQCARYVAVPAALRGPKATVPPARI